MAYSIIEGVEGAQNSISTNKPKRGFHCRGCGPAYRASRGPEVSRALIQYEEEKDAQTHTHTHINAHADSYPC